MAAGGDNMDWAAFYTELYSRTIETQHAVGDVGTYKLADDPAGYLPDALRELTLPEPPHGGQCAHNCVCGYQRA
jgi:hypothetical protein